MEQQILRPWERLRSIVMGMSVCLSVCMSTRISPEPHMRSLPNFLCLLPMSVTRSSSGNWLGCISGVHNAGEVSSTIALFDNNSFCRGLIMRLTVVTKSQIPLRYLASELLASWIAYWNLALTDSRWQLILFFGDERLLKELTTLLTL